jgi:LCP family protein required for cell wall assembly
MIGRGGRHFRSRSHRSWGQRVVLTIGTLLTLACLAVASVVAYAYARFGSIPRFEGLTVEEAPPGEPENFLIVGSDTRTGSDEEGSIGGQRSDTIIVARILPEETTMEMVSFPRDLVVDIAGPQGRAKINAAYNQGRQTLIDTITENFGVPINHYVEIDFAGFQRLVDAIGGVPVYLDTTYRDDESGLYAEGPGCVTLDGANALAFARGRNLQYIDPDTGDWEVDGTGDLGRIGRQQYFFREALDRVLDLNPATDLLTFNRLIDVAVDSVGVDENLSNDDIRNLSSRFRDFNPESIINFSLPVDTARDARLGSILNLREREAQPILNVFRGLPPDAVTAANVLVEVQNGTGVENQARDAAAALDAVGFETTVNRDAPEVPASTTVQYAPGSERAAQLVARHLTSRAVLEVDESLAANEVRLVTGPDFTTVVRQPWPEEAVLLPTTTTTSAPAGGATSSTVPPPTTTTTIIGVVPEAPPGVTC